jgi:RNA polymerase sigma-70 factor (ECF subfamily)
MMDVTGGSVAYAIATKGVTEGSDEPALVARAQAGDRYAFDALIGPRIDRLLRLALSIVSNDADASDAVQEACLHAWRDLRSLREPDRFEAWLWRIAINACRSSLRTRRRAFVREIAVDAMPPGEELHQPGQQLGDHLSETDLVERAFRRLDPDKRTILVLHHVEGRSVSDIAGLLRIPVGTAKWRLFSARQALERALQVERR